MNKNIIAHMLGAVLVGAVSMNAVAQDNYPTRTIKIIVPLAPGGGTAIALPRIVADKLSERWGRPVIVEYRPGAAGNIGAEAVVRADPDGYTLLASPPPALVINQHLYKLSFDPAALVPVTIIAAVPFVLVAHPKVPVANVQELIAFAKTNPARLNYASAGAGSVPHVAMEWFKVLSGAPILHVPYKGLAPALSDLLTGHVDMMFDNLGNALHRVESGTLKALAVASEKRLPTLPLVPAIAESFPSFVSDTWFAVVAPPKTPRAIAAKLSAAIGETLRMPDVASRIRDFSAVPLGTSPEESQKFLREDAERWRKVILATGIKLE